MAGNVSRGWLEISTRVRWIYSCTGRGSIPNVWCSRRKRSWEFGGAGEIKEDFSGHEEKCANAACCGTPG